MDYELISNLINCKVGIIEKIIQEKGENKRRIFEQKFKELSRKTRNVYCSSFSKELAVMGYNEAVTTKKVNPFIAGGLANGLFGAGAGIYTAINTANNNASIDNNKKYYEQRITETEQQFTEDEIELYKYSQELYEELDKIIPNFANFFGEEIERVKHAMEKRKKEEKEQKEREMRKKNIDNAVLGCILLIVGILGIIFVEIYS